MKKPSDWISLAVALAAGGGFLLGWAREGDVPVALAVIVLVVASAVLFVGLVAHGVKLGLRDAGVVGVAPAPSEPAAAQPSHESREESPEEDVNGPREAADQVQQILAEGPANHDRLSAVTGLNERELKAALDLLTQRGVVEMGSKRRWQLRSE